MGVKIKNPYPMLDLSIKITPLSSIVVLPIYAEKPLVKVGDKVLTMQKLANGVHSSISGEVIKIADVKIPHVANLQVPSITIKSDGKDENLPLVQKDNFLLKTPQELLIDLENSGIIGLGGAGFPTATKLKYLKNCHTIIINACECEPAVEADNAIMIEYGREVLRGVEILLHITKAQKAIIAIEDDKLEAFESLLMFNNNSKIKIITVPTIYGSGAEKTLIEDVLEVKIESGKFASDYGILIQNIATTKAIADYIIDGIPLIKRVVSDLTLNPQNLEVRIGTLLDEISGEKNLRVGGLMMGLDLKDNDYPILKTTNAIFKQQPKKNATECIRCGKCVKVCPSDLLPQQLYWFAKIENIDKCLDYNLLDCTSCGCCDAVCPSNISLAQYFTIAKVQHKNNIIKELEMQKSTQRFEFREYRLQRNKQERDEMMARKRAEIKTKMAKKTNEL